MIETDIITGRDLGALKQNKEKHSLISLLGYIMNVTIPIKGAKDIRCAYSFEKLYHTLDTVFNDDNKKPWGMFIVFVILDFKMTSYS